MLKRFRDYIENGDWERYLDEDARAVTIFCWIAIGFSIAWFVPTMIRILIWGPGQ